MFFFFMEVLLSVVGESKYGHAIHLALAISSSGFRKEIEV